ncbi:MAG: hypothetical protein HYZ88_03155 [Candidatus Omnitrophica bacterium]|nr:hypothetical protein [Candidatus Omnitrophota bacterium]
MPHLKTPAAAVIFVGMILSMAPRAGAVYNAKGKRDPFVPLLTAEGQRIHPPGLDEETTVGVSGLILQGIVFDPQGDSTAVINGKIVREQEEIIGMRVIRIQPSAVVVLAEGQEHRLELHRPQSETAEEESTP